MKSSQIPRILFNRATVFGAIFLCCSLVACTNNNAQSSGTEKSSRAQIDLQVEGAPAGEVMLVATIGDQRFVQDTTQALAGESFTFSSDKPYPSGLYMAYFQDKTAVQFLIDEDQEFSLKTKKSDIINSMEVKGSRANELYFDSGRFEHQLQAKLQAAGDRLNSLAKGSSEYAQAKTEQDKLIAERKKFLEDMFASNPNNFFTTFKRAGQNPDLRTDLVLADGSPDNTAQVEAYRTEFWDNVDFSDSSLLRTPVIFNKLKRYMEQLTPQNAKAVIESANMLMDKVIDHPAYLRYFANWITLKYEPGNTTLMDGEAVYVNMIRKYFTKERAFWSDSMTVYGLQQRAAEMAQSLTGQAGPNITVNDLNGQPRTLYDEKAPYIIVFLYNPTCEHCIEQTPKVLSLVRNRPERDVALYAIAIDTEEAAWKKFVKQYSMEAFTNVYDPTNRSIYKTYYVDHTPELYLLNPQREIIGKNLKASQVAESIARDKAEQGTGKKE